MKTSASKSLAINGGQPLRTKAWPTPLNGAVALKRSQLKAARSVLKSRRLFRYDDRPYNQTAAGIYENLIRDFFQTKHALALNSCTTAIATGLLACDLPPNSVVACSSFTFAATPSAIVLAGHKPLLIETTTDFHFDLEDLKRKFTPEIKALVVVHMRGMGSDMPAIMQFAREKNIPVIEDCAAVCGVEFNNQLLGTFGDIAAFSTQSNKFINSGEGGFLITNNELLFERALTFSGAYVPCYFKHFATKPANPEIPYQYPIYSFRIDEIRAAIAYPQIPELKTNLLKQQAIYHEVVTKLAEIDGIRIRQPLDPNSVLGNKLIFRLPDASGEEATWFAKALRAEGIEASAIGNPTLHNQRAFWNWQFVFADPIQIQQQLPNSYRYISECIDIPLSITLSSKDIDDLVTAIKKIVTN